MKAYKRIREGMTLEKAKELLSQETDEIKNVYLMIKIFNIGRDVFGNAIAHYQCSLVTEYYDYLKFRTVVTSGHHRQQIGYGRVHEDALYCLEKLGYKISDQPIETTNSYDCFKILNI